jgi:hypothetical protein
MFGKAIGDDGFNEKKIGVVHEVISKQAIVCFYEVFLFV